MKFRILAGALLLVTATLGWAQQGLDNDAVVKMVKSGLSDAVIVSMIQGQAGTYTITPDSMIALKQGGVSDQVLAAMAAKASGVSVAPVAATAPAVGEFDDLDPGVYIKQKGSWTPVPAERVNWKTGGFLKHTLSYGVVKEDKNGHIEGVGSATKATTPVEFLIKVKEGDEATDYQLVHLHEQSNSREFRIMTGGVIHESGGATRDNVKFEEQKTAKRCYLVSLPQGTVPGEYGFLAPGLTESSASGSTGKAFTFHFIE